jgi:hypothetical protein
MAAARVMGRGAATTLPAAGLLALLAACAPPGDRDTGALPEDTIQPAAAASTGQHDDVPAMDGHLRAFVDSVRSAEARRLEDAAGTVHRASLTRLVVTPRAAPPVTLEDDVTGGDLLRLHVYRGRLLDRFVVLEVIFYEGGQFLLVDEHSGEERIIDGLPVGSPDGTRFVTTSLDLVAGHQANRIAIYRVRDGAIEREWAEEPRGWGPSEAEWIEPGVVRFRRNVIDTNTQPHAVSQAVGWVDYTATGWRLRR